MDPHKLLIVGISIGLTVIILIISAIIPFKDSIHWYIYAKLLRLEHALRPLPPGINNIVLVTIDNNTLNTMTEKWPYPRACFYTVIDNLKKAGARAIGFDFVFYGNSTEEEKELLKKVIGNDKNIVLGAGIDDAGRLSTSTTSELKSMVRSGLVTKLEDSDGEIRKCPTYFVKHHESKRAFLSWELLLMKAAGELDINSIESQERNLSFEKLSGKSCSIPVEKDTKAFLIHYRANTTDFNRISFASVFKNNFNPRLVKDKIIIVGLASQLLQDIHNTPFGWLPGVTLNANTFLNVYSCDFLKEIPMAAQIFVIFLSTLLLTFVRIFFKKHIFVILLALAQILIFFIASYTLLTCGYVWNYFLFPFVIIFMSLICGKFPLTYY